MYRSVPGKERSVTLALLGHRGSLPLQPPSHRLTLTKGRGLLLPAMRADACLFAAWVGRVLQEGWICTGRYKKLLSYFSRTLIVLPQ